MKKTIVTILAAITVCNMAFARNDEPNIGIGAGWTATSKQSTLKSDKSTNSELLNGWYVGIDYTFRELLGPINLVPGVQFSQIFSKKEQFGVPGIGKYTEQDIIADIKVPVDFSWSYNFGKIEPYIAVGPTFDFGITSRTVKRLNDGYKEEDMHYRKDTDYRSFNILIGGGIGCRFGCIRISARYDYGLLNRWKGKTAETKHMTDQLITVGAAYCF